MRDGKLINLAAACTHTHAHAHSNSYMHALTPQVPQENSPLIQIHSKLPWVAIDVPFVLVAHVRNFPFKFLHVIVVLQPKN